MNNVRRRRELGNTNQGSSAEARLHPRRGFQGLGGTNLNAPSVGAGTAYPTRSGDDHAPANPRWRGGQASGPGLFGLGGRRTTVRFQHVPAAPRRSPLPPTRVRGALSPHASDGLTPAAYQARVAVGTSNFFAQAATESARREEQEWRELADLAAQPEWDRAALYGGAGSVERALAED